MHACAGPRADDKVDPEVLQRRIEHLLDIGQQPVNLVDEEDLSVLDRGEHAGQIQLLLQDRAGGVVRPHFELVRDDRG